ncbi:GDSL esterase/lipase At3g53100-like [Andrographis paniculata]|uniref:GDSL esterase/lipase At3g53100-like n=1 Tax=Andrographis paniculata TaxID=175694 RepID=UPI0021E90D38|nr:GDSL esterase/lipase At3g53100-like [Andrographis paniculata]
MKKMSRSCCCKFGVFLAASMVLMSSVKVDGDPIVPALCIFGDSVVDVGNNNKLLTLIKADFPPYGRDFAAHKPTGRFCNGKLATDFIAEYLGFSSYPPAYLSKEAKGVDLINGANFASAGSGYYDQTAHLYGALSLPKQLEYYRDWQRQVVDFVGQDKADTIISQGIHVVSTGSSDYIQNYYINPLVRSLSHDQFSDILIKSFSCFIQNLYNLGARRVGVTSLPPIGCLPAAITIFGQGSDHCVTRLNQDAVAFNEKLHAASRRVKAELPGLKLVIFDVYNPLLDMISDPADDGFAESRKACCGTGLIETSFLCNKLSLGTCRNATEYVFWDGFHPSEAANEELANKLLEQGYQLIFN